VGEADLLKWGEGVGKVEGDVKGLGQDPEPISDVEVHEELCPELPEFFTEEPDGLVKELTRIRKG
jgi:hypothetical protein